MEIEQLLAADEGWLIAHAGHLDRGVRVELVPVLVAPLPEIAEPSCGAQGEQPGPGVEQPPAADQRHQQSGRHRRGEELRHEPQLGDRGGLDGAHADVVVQPVDAVEIIGLEPRDLVHPDPEPEPFGVLRRHQLDPPQRSHVHRQQQERGQGHHEA